MAPPRAGAGARARLSPGTTSGAVSRRSVATTLCATTADVRGFAEATFASRSESSPKPPRAVSSATLAESDGSATTRATVPSKPIPARATAAATFVVFG